MPINYLPTCPSAMLSCFIIKVPNQSKSIPAPATPATTT